MGLIKRMTPEIDPTKFFENLSQVGEIRLSRSAAKLVCRLAEGRSVWVLGVDVGILDPEGRYTEDFNEGWVTKTGVMQPNIREQLAPNTASRAVLRENNWSAEQAIEQTPSQFNAFILTARLVSINNGIA